MKLKEIFIFTMLLFAAANVSAQYSTKNKKALELFKQGNNALKKSPAAAVQYYQQAFEKDKKFVEAAWKLSDAYGEMVDEENQVNALLPTVGDKYKKHKKYKECQQHLAKAYYETGQYEKAKEWYEKADPTKNMAAMRRCDVAIKLKANPIPFDPENMGELVNTEFDDYWPNISADGRTFSTTVLVGKKEGERQNYTHNEDIYQCQKNGKEWGQSEALGAPIQTKKNEGAQSYSLDGKYMFYVACDRKTSLGGCDIYYSIKKDGHWSEEINPGEPLNSKSWESTPSLSSDGSTIYFASNRKGGIGGDDIWKCDVTVNADETLSFSNPVNLGEQINTMRNERSPFIHPDNQTLYFSSDGWDGMGKLDVFYARKDAYGNWTRAENMGYPLNTHRDEIGFVVNSDGDKAYFSSNGLENNGRGKDIYEAYLDERLRPKKVDFFIGKVIDDETEAPLEATIKLFNAETEAVVSHSKSDRFSGKIILPVPSTGETFAYTASAEGYMPKNEKVQNVNTGIEHEIRLTKAKAGSSIVLKNVFFDTNSYNLKDESKFELDQIIAFMNANPNIRVRFEGHTDSQGSRQLNTKLSDNRAKAVKKYLIEHGIAADRMEAVGFGPDRPTSTNDTEEGRALNRRTEMVVLE
ncbi:MAG: PD40 domain-containing protein [Paludibacteraceae bacterium]|nr:PD40 domain-containing protein [Paludibacteraceae bacterium]